MTPATKHLDFLDGLRGVAILMVIFFHSFGTSFGYQFLPWHGQFRSVHGLGSSLLFFPALFGWGGVAVFFAVSGFCIHISFARNPDQGYPHFFIRRFFRIYPPYFAALILCALLEHKMRHDLMTFSSAAWMDLGTHLFLVHNFYNPIEINPALWSIAVEIQLYLLYPLVLFIVKKSSWAYTLLLIGSIEVVMRTCASVCSFLTGNSAQGTATSLTGGLPYYFIISPFVYWFSWVIGAWVAECFVNQKKCSLQNFPVTLWLALAVGCYLWKWTSAFCFMFFAIATAAMISKWMIRKTPPRPFTIIRHIGIWSYSLYLLHNLPIWKFSTFYPQPGDIEFFICLSSMIVSVPMAFIFYKWCEVPSLNFGKRLTKRKDSSHFVAG